MLSLPAQSNLLPGTVVDLQGDTLRGFIDFQEWEINPERIQFKAEKEGTTSKFEVAEIRGFQVAGERYESAKVELETSDLRTISLTYNSEPVLEEKEVFLRQLVAGEKELWVHRDLYARDNFFIRSDGELTLLLYKRYFQDNEEVGKVIRSLNKFRGELRKYFIACPQIHERIRRSSYDEKSLLNVFETYYNACGEKPASYLDKETQKTSLSFGLLAGAGIGQLNIRQVSDPSGNRFDELWDTDFSSSTNVTFGASLALILPRKRAKWSFTNSLLFNKWQTQGQYRKFDSPIFYNDYDFNIQVSSLKLHMQIRYKYLLGESSAIFINGGFASLFNLSITNEVVVTRSAGGIESTETTTAIPGLDTYKYGPTLGMGVQFLDHYLLELRFEQLNNMTSVSNLKSNIRYFYVLAGYEF